MTTVHAITGCLFTHLFSLTSITQAIYFLNCYMIYFFLFEMNLIFINGLFRYFFCGESQLLRRLLMVHQARTGEVEELLPSTSFPAALELPRYSINL
jgi:hypothetical protein